MLGYRDGTIKYNKNIQSDVIYKQCPENGLTTVLRTQNKPALTADCMSWVLECA